MRLENKKNGPFSQMFSCIDDECGSSVPAYDGKPIAVSPFDSAKAAVELHRVKDNRVEQLKTMKESGKVKPEEAYSLIGMVLEADDLEEMGRIQRLILSFLSGIRVVM